MLCGEGEAITYYLNYLFKTFTAALEHYTVTVNNGTIGTCGKHERYKPIRAFSRFPSRTAQIDETYLLDI